MSKLEFDELSDEAVSISNVKWKIAHFYFLLKESDFSVESPRFLAAGATWYLQMYRNKRKYSNKKSVCCVDIRIVRLDTLYPQHSVSFSFKIKDFDGGGNQSYAGKVDIKENHESLVLHSSFNNCLEKENSIWTPEDSSLTLFGTLYIKRNQLAKKVDAPSETDSLEMEGGHVKLAHDLKRLLLCETDSDLTIKVKGREFPAHRAIIAVRSPVFAAMLRSEMKEKASGVVEITDLDPDVFPDFLCFLYTGRINTLSAENAFGLYAAANKYDVTELKSSCSQFMKSSLSIDIICDVVTVALRHEEKELLEEAVGYFAQHVIEIMKTVKWQAFISENPIQGNELLIKALQKQKN